jgi:hypothetical protein
MNKQNPIIVKIGSDQASRIEEDKAARHFIDRRAALAEFKAQQQFVRTLVWIGVAHVVFAGVFLILALIIKN